MDPAGAYNTLPVRKPLIIPRDPPPAYEVSVNPRLVITTETTPLLSSLTPPPSPQRSRRPTRVGREPSFTSTIDQTIRDHSENENAPLLDAIPPLPPPSLPQRIQVYFSAYYRREYWLSALHLTVINFPFALAAWVFLFVGTLVGTTLLLTLPFGVIIWWGTLLGARAFSRWEVALQKKFHLRSHHSDLSSVPYIYQPSVSNQPQSPVVSVSALLLESGSAHSGSDIGPPPAYQGSFLRTTYAMFLDPASYQPLFYFIVIKGTTALLLTPIVLVFVPVSLVLIVPGPFVLRLVRRVGLWQAELAMEALDWVVIRD